MSNAVSVSAREPSVIKYVYPLSGYKVQYASLTKSPVAESAKLYFGHFVCDMKDWSSVIIGTLCQFFNPPGPSVRVSVRLGVIIEVFYRDL